MAVKRSSTHAMKKRPTHTQEELAHQKALDIEKKCYKYGAIAAVVIVILIILNQFDLLPHLNGSMRYYNGSVYGKADNDIVVQTDKNANRYYNLGSYTAPEGYTITETEQNPQTVISSNPDYNVSFCYMENESIEGLSYVYIKGVAKSMDAIAEQVIEQYTTEDANGSKTVPAQYNGTTANGNKYRVVIIPVASSEGTGFDLYYYQTAPMYIEAGHGLCIMVDIITKSTTATDFPEDEFYVNTALEIANCIKVY